MGYTGFMKIPYARLWAHVGLIGLIGLVGLVGLIGTISISCDEGTDASGRCEPNSCEERAGGICEANGYCSYPEAVDQCATALVWGSDAPPDLADQCVRAEPAEVCGCLDDGLECTRERCAADRCIHPPDYDGNGCTEGLCYAGECCAGCWDGEVCQAGDVVAACGGHGGACQQCPTDDACYTYSCNSFCYAELLGGPGCPPCGAVDEPCCAGDVCDGALTCTSVSCGEDCIEDLCQ